MIKLQQNFWRFKQEKVTSFPNVEWKTQPVQYFGRSPNTICPRFRQKICNAPPHMITIHIVRRLIKRTTRSGNNAYYLQANIDEGGEEGKEGNAAGSLTVQCLPLSPPPPPQKWGQAKANWEHLPAPPFTPDRTGGNPHGMLCSHCFFPKIISTLQGGKHFLWEIQVF